MKVDGQHFTAIWLEENSSGPPTIKIIDQRWLPHELVIEELATVEQVATAIRDMHLRGAPLIGAAAAFGVYLAIAEAPEGGDFYPHFNQSIDQLRATRPTAVNLSWALDRQINSIDRRSNQAEKLDLALEGAREILSIETENCRRIGINGLPLIKKLSQKKNGQPLNILTHCNAGWLACVDYGTATAPIYLAHDQGIPLHVWVDETRPRNQGARLTAWELQKHGIPHTVITDNAGGHLMQHGLVDLVLVGSDRTTRRGDVANKIGTYLKALAARDNGIPFYVALPSSTLDFSLTDGLAEIPIEQRHADEVSTIQGLDISEEDPEVRKKIKQLRLTPAESPAANYAFDVTPARLVTALITERGICAAREEAILDLFPERKSLL